VSSMGNMLISAGAALVAGVCLAATGLLQQKAASKESSENQFSLQMIWNLAREERKQRGDAAPSSARATAPAHRRVMSRTAVANRRELDRTDL
jgi:hypothetical protein